jgi:hypothetical protein
MSHRLALGWALSLLTWLSAGSLLAQTTLYSESFETDGNPSRYTTSTPEFSDGGSDFFTRTDGSNISGGYEVTGADGSFYFAAQDLDGEGAAATQSLTVTGIDITGFSGLSFSALLAEDDDGTSQDWDNGDIVFVEARINGGAWVKILQFVNDGATFSTEPGLDTDFDGIRDGAPLTSTFTSFMAAISGTGTTLDLRITSTLDSGDEDVAFDLLEVTGTTSGTGGPLVSDTLYCESYETDGEGSRYTATGTFNDGVNDHFQRTDGSDISNVSGAYTGANGSFFFAAEDIDDSNGQEPKFVTSFPFSIAGYDQISFSGLFGAGNANPAGANAYDAADYARVSFSTDGGATFTDMLQFSYVDNGDAFNEPLALDTNFDGNGDGPLLGPTLQAFGYAFNSGDLSGAATMVIRVEVSVDAGNEEFAFDNLKVIGQASGGVCQDSLAPLAACVPALTLYLDPTNPVTLTPADLDAGSSDDCSTVAQLSFALSQELFTCADIGVTPVILTVTDAAGESSTCSSDVTVVDTVAPLLLTQAITVYLDASGQASITASDVDGGSSDNCNLTSLTVSPATFTCEDLRPDTAVDASSLFFSEYVEGSGLVKYLEIFNGTGSTVDLADYQVELYSNGNATPNDLFALSGSLANGAVLVVANPSATGYAGPVVSDGVVNFNGDDAVALRRLSDATLVDVFGVIGEDPGSEWNVNGVETSDHTLRRQASVTHGTVASAGFPELDDEWSEFPINTLDGLGSHQMEGFYTGTTVTLTAIDQSGNATSATALVLVVDSADVCGCNVALDSVRVIDESCDGAEDGGVTILASGATNYEYSIDGGLTWQASGSYPGLPMGPYYAMVRDADNPSCVSDSSVVIIAPGLMLPTFSTLAQSGSCLGSFDGSIELTANSGVGPFLYSIDGAAFVPGGVPYTFTNVAAGDHQLRIQDSTGCISQVVEVITTATLPPSFKLQSVVDATDSSSQDGRFRITPLSGEAPFLYSIDDGATYLSGPAPKSFANLNPGCYEVRIQDANGCESSSRTFCVNDLTVCPPRDDINRKFKYNGSRDNNELRNVCEGESFSQWYKLRYLGSGESMRIDWKLEEVTGKIGERATYNGSVPAPDAISGSDGPFGNGYQTFDANAGLLGLEDQADRSDNLIFSVTAVLLVDGAACAADPNQYKAIVYPTPEMVLTNASQPGQTLRINSGDDPNGAVSVHSPVDIAEQKALLQYDLHIDATPAIAELATDVDVLDVGSDDQNRDYDGFTALASVGITSFTNLTGMPITVTIELTPRLIPADANAGACTGVTQRIDLIVLPQSASREARGLTLDPAARQAWGDQYEVYPNPARQWLTVVVPSELETVHRLELTDLRGRVLLSETLSDSQSQVRLPLSGLSEGIYLLRVSDAAGLVTVRKVQKL